MDFIKKHIVFFVLIALGVLSFALFATLYYLGQKELQAVQESNIRKQGTIASLLGSRDLTPTAENLAAMQAYHDALDAQYNKLVGEMLREDLTTKLFANPPASNERFAIDHLGFREELRRLATERRDPERPILLDAKVADFGFAEYSGVPPRAELVKDLYEQRKIIDFLVKELYQTGPAKLVSVNRGVVNGELDAPSTSGSRDRGMAVGAARRAIALPQDVFEISEQISARVPGVVDTIPIQIVFEGKTPTLRNFLNKIVDSKYPILVRNVEVRPLLGASRQATSTPRPTTRRGSRQATPAAASEENTDPEALIIPEGYNVVIADNRSEFTVTLEFLLPSRDKASEQGE